MQLNLNKYQIMNNNGNSLIENVEKGKKNRNRNQNRNGGEWRDINSI